MEKTKLKSAQEYIIKVLNGMALGLFSSLIIGLILKQMGVFLNIPLLEQFGSVAQLMMSGAIGAGVAFSIGAPGLVVFSALIAGALGGGAVNVESGSAILSIGEPVGALVAGLAGAEVGKRVFGKTKVDIILVPASTIIVGGLLGHFLAPAISAMMNSIGAFINFATTTRPFIMGILVSVTMGIVLTLPISSAALGISLGLSGLASGAAIVGCCCHMVGFAVASFRENKWGGLISQGIGTSMIQIPNIVRNPLISIPAIVASAILGPVSTIIFKMEGDPIGAGMGTSGLVGQFSTINVMGSSVFPQMILLHFILPAVIAFVVSEVMRKKGWIKAGDMSLEKNN